MAEGARDVRDERAETPSGELVYRIRGGEGAVPVVYLPGVHGDWTPQAAASVILAGAFRLVEISYPREPLWRLEDYASALVSLLDRLEIESAHVVAESFGSLVGWEFGLEHGSRVRSMVIVGGFCQPPGPRKVLLAKWGLSVLPTGLFEQGVDAYVAIRKHRGKLEHPEMEVDLPYATVRTDLGRIATVSRFEIMCTSDYRHQLHEVLFPVRYIGGDSDLIVPVKREIRTLSELLSEEAGFQSRLIANAPHMIISSHPVETAGQIADWIMEVDGREGTSGDQHPPGEPVGA
ncbi:MAG: alpha/beta hydrolase [Candidatus Hydrogenedentes bacterium]|nr:alpha/beta hydrolase [Candidatus Hydrogenedentota bacterium]